MNHGQTLAMTAALLLGLPWGGPVRADTVPEVPTDALSAVIRRKELINGQWKYYVRVGITPSLLRARGFTLVRPDRASSWLLERSRGGASQGARFRPDRVETLRLPDGTVITASLVFDSHRNQFKQGDTVTPFVTGTRHEKDRDQAVLFYPDKPAVFAEAPLSPFSYSLSAGYGPDQEMEDGAHRSALHIPLKLRLDPILTGQQLGEFHLESNDLLSSETPDRGSQIELGLGFLRRSTLIESNHFLAVQSSLQYISSQSFNSQALRFALGGSTDVGIPGLMLGTVVSSPFGPLVRFSPINYEHRLRRNLDLPSISNSDLYYASVNVSWSPLYLFAAAQRASRDRSAWLVLDLTGYWFPNLETAGGYNVSHVEGQVGLRLNVPLRTPLLKSRLFVSYTAGVNEAEQFARSSTVTVGIAVLGSDFKLLGF